MHMETATKRVEQKNKLENSEQFTQVYVLQRKKKIEMSKTYSMHELPRISYSHCIAYMNFVLHIMESYIDINVRT